MSLSILLKKIRTCRNFVIQLGGQGGRGEECLKVAQPVTTFKLLCELMSCLEEVQSLSPSLNVCAHVNAWRWCDHNLHLEMCVLTSMLGGGRAIISILTVCVCALMSMLIPTLKRVCAHVNAWRCHSHNLHLFLNLECVLMSMLGGGTK